MAETINSKEWSQDIPKPKNWNNDTQKNYYEERFRPEVISDEVKDIFKWIGIKQYPSPRNPNSMKFDLPNYLIANVNWWVAKDETWSPDWKTFTFNNSTKRVEFQNWLIVETDKSWEQTKIDIKLASPILRKEKFMPQIDGTLGIPPSYILQSMSTWKSYNEEIKWNSPIADISTQRSRTNPNDLVINITFMDWAKESFIWSKHELFIKSSAQIANSNDPQRSQVIGIEVNQDGNKVKFDVNWTLFTLTKTNDVNWATYIDQFNRKWIEKRVWIQRVLTQQN